ncbi:MAG: hypothetical protein EBZ61_09545 [Micrococcales bacterium]|nr:hypothetical protein [Micrococcales bacterium]
MPWPVHPTGFFGARGDSDTYRIERSLRFNSADSAYLNRTPASAGNRKTWTWSGWVKRSALSGTIQLIEAAGTLASTETTRLYFGFGVTENFIIGYGGADWRATTQLFRDISSWYHIVVAFDSGNATALNRIKLYVNGSQITSFSTTNTVTSNTDGALNNNIEHFVGRDSAANQYYFNGYLTEINFIDGQALTPSSFGETDAITGRWKAKAYSGTYGTNGFYLKFADNSGTTATTLGKDSSPNGNNWTPNNFVVSPVTSADNDSLVDSPTNYGTDTRLGGEVRGNYCTLNPLDTSVLTCSNGNLIASSSTVAWNTMRCTIGVSSGKWYWEYSTSYNNSAMVGIQTQGVSLATYLGNTSTGYGYNAIDGKKYNNGTAGTYGASYTSGDIIGVAFDADAGTLTFYKNNTSQGIAYSSIPSGTYFPAVSIYAEIGTVTNTVNFGQRPFAYTAPTGFKALCTQNLTQPTIQKPSKYMDALAYTGTGASNAISSLGFSPDLVWIKNRGTTTDHALYDIVRGAQAQLSSNTTGSEITSSTGLTAFGSAGFTIGTSSLVNTNGTQYVAWSWDAGSTTSTNNSGSITSTVRANPQAGFSIVSFTAPNSSSPQTVGHGLGVAPKMFFVKARSSSGNWNFYHSSLGATKYLFLNTTDAEATNSNRWNNTAPTSSVITLGSNFVPDASLTTYIAYCFSEIEGYSKFGSYTGNGSADGPFVWCGFRPRWVMIKRTDTNLRPWCIHDTGRDISNVSNSELEANSSTAENGGTYPGDLDILSNGLKLREGSSAWINENGGTYIFVAFAESPFKYARAR